MEIQYIQQNRIQRTLQKLLRNGLKNMTTQNLFNSKAGSFEKQHCREWWVEVDFVPNLNQTSAIFS